MPTPFTPTCKPPTPSQTPPLLQMPQSVPRRFIVSPQKIHIEDILPGFSPQRARLNLAQADIAQSEDTERLEQRSRNIRDLKRNRSLIRVRRNKTLVRAFQGVGLKDGKV